MDFETELACFKPAPDLANWVSQAFSQLQSQTSHTFYLRYQGPLPAANDVKVDITINEVLASRCKIVRFIAPTTALTIYPRGQP